MATQRKTTAKSAVKTAAKTAAKPAAAKPVKRAVRKRVKKRSNRRGGRGFFFAMLFVLALALVYFFFGAQIEAELGIRQTGGVILLEADEILVSFIDVGQGDAILVRSQDHAVLIDGGEHAQRNALTGYLRAAGIRRLDYVVATHPHSDHIGGLVTVLGQFEIGHVVMPDITHNTATFERFLEVIDN
ncbi:MAG: MBL fold metallo-hydrolase, partial [Defluviitaleaceae bacterium]|nr:MBL fold metallo-hydrolase [Defluviitaleaceae bacterium]